MKTQTKIIVATALVGLMQMGLAGIPSGAVSAASNGECHGVNFSCFSLFD